VELARETAVISVVRHAPRYDALVMAFGQIHPVIAHPGTDGIEPRHKRSAAGHADRTVAESIFEEHALGGETVEVRR